MAEQPLDRLVAIDLSESIAGQYCCRLLADYGAEVVLAEPPDGSAIRRMPPFRPGTDESLLFAHLNAGKRSLIADAAIIGRLAATADIVVVGRDGDGPALAEAHPRAVVATVSDFGRDGSYAGWQGSEMIHQALSSVMFSNGRQDEPPLYGCGHRASYAAGLASYVGVLAALHERDRSGLGQHVDVSVAEVAASMTTGPTAYGYSGQLDGGRGRGESLIRCRGEWVLLWIYPFQWRDFCAALELGPLEHDPRFAGTDERQANWAALMAELQERFADSPADDIVARLQARRLITAKAASLFDLATGDVPLEARGVWQRDGDAVRLRRPFGLGAEW